MLELFELIQVRNTWAEQVSEYCKQERRQWHSSKNKSPNMRVHRTNTETVHDAATTPTKANALVRQPEEGDGKEPHLHLKKYLKDSENTLGVILGRCLKIYEVCHTEALNSETF